MNTKTLMHLALTCVAAFVMSACEDKAQTANNPTKTPVVKEAPATPVAEASTPGLTPDQEQAVQAVYVEEAAVEITSENVEAAALALEKELESDL